MSEPGYTETKGFDAIVVSVDADAESFMVSKGGANKRFFFEEVSDCDVKLVKVGAKFSYSEGWLITSAGHKAKTACITFRGDDDGGAEQT